jgi:transglutaminase-like putative cysteine protease
MSFAVPFASAPTDADLAPTVTFDFDDAAVGAFARDAVAGADDEAERARRIFAAVRERIRYTPYALSLERSAFTASATLAAGRNWCVPKAILLTASARAVGIPARLGFADVRNHLSSERLLESMGTDLFVYHGYAALHVGGAWRKVSPAFNAALCARFGVPALEFDGRSDALMHAYDGAGRRHMEYVADHGTYSDVPFDELWPAFAAHYDVDRMLAASGVPDAAFDAPAAP